MPKIQTRKSATPKRKASKAAPRKSYRKNTRSARARALHEEHVFERQTPALPLTEFLAGLTAVGRSIPPDVHEKVPRDLARNVEHYLYGTPKEAT